MRINNLLDSLQGLAAIGLGIFMVAILAIKFIGGGFIGTSRAKARQGWPFMVGLWSFGAVLLIIGSWLSGLAEQSALAGTLGAVIVFATFAAVGLSTLAWLWAAFVRPEIEI